MKLICKTAFPDGVQVSGIGTFKKGDVLVRNSANAAVFDELANHSPEWERVDSGEPIKSKKPREE